MTAILEFAAWALLEASTDVPRLLDSILSHRPAAGLGAGADR